MSGYIGARVPGVISVPSRAEVKNKFVITSTQSVFTGLVYTTNLVEVFHNGIRLVDGTDFTATDGSTITLTESAVNGDEIVIIAASTFIPTGVNKDFVDGLDINADTLDGQHGSHYVDFANATNKPTTLAGYGITDAEPIDATILKDADIGVNVQGYNANYVVDATYVKTDENFTTADHSKLDGIEAGATADQTKADVEGLGIAFSSISATPTTVAGYGITDASTTTEMNAAISTAVGNLIDSAPTALDTLNEIAASLGDDADFAGSMTTNLASKLNLSGGALTGDITTNSLIDGRNVSADGNKLDTVATSANNYVHPSAHPISFITGLQTALDNINTDLVNDTTPQLGGALDVNGHSISFGDNEKARFGNADDFQIYHDGSHSYIKDTGTGDLYIQGEANVRITDGDGNKMFLGQNDGEVQLYYNGLEKLHTTSTGINVIGNVAVSGTVDGRDVATDGTKLDGIATGANDYVHPTSAGNKHIPSGGASGQILGYSSSGTAVWTDPAGGASVLFDSNNWANANLASNNGNTASFSGGTNGRWVLATAVTGGNGNNIGGGGQTGINGTGGWIYAHLAGSTTGVNAKSAKSGETIGSGASIGGNIGITGWVPAGGNLTIKSNSQSNNGTWQPMNMSIKYRNI